MLMAQNMNKPTRVRSMADRQEIMISVANKATHAGLAVSCTSGLAGWIAQNQDLLAGIGLIIGILMSIGGFLLNWYYRRAHLKLAQEAQRGNRRKEDSKEVS
jgi:hypothetical protein